MSNAYKKTSLTLFAVMGLADKLAASYASRDIQTEASRRKSAEHDWLKARQDLRTAILELFEQAKASGAPEYTSMMGSAAQEYYDSVGKQAHPLPAQFRWQECYEAMLSAASHGPRRDAEIARLRTALRFYARGQHYTLDDSEEFDTVSGEPPNWLHSGLEESATSIETGVVAQLALRGIEITWKDGGEDETPQPIEGEC